MTKTTGVPIPDCGNRRLEARQRREAVLQNAQHVGDGPTMPNGEEVEYGLSFAANYHKALPHDVQGFVHRESYSAMVRMLSGQESGALELCRLEKTVAPCTPRQLQTRRDSRSRLTALTVSRLTIES